MKLIIAGSRTCPQTVEIVEEAIKSSGINISAITKVFCGGAKGADFAGRLWANSHKIAVHYYPANWERYGLAAGHIRNAQMGDNADELLALWDGESKGTKHMISYMRNQNKPVYIYELHI